MNDLALKSDSMPVPTISEGLCTELFYALPYGRCAQKDCGCQRFEADPEQFSPKKPICTVCTHQSGFHSLGTEADRAYGMRRRQNLMKYCLITKTMPQIGTLRIEEDRSDDIHTSFQHEHNSNNDHERLSGYSGSSGSKSSGRSIQSGSTSKSKYAEVLARDSIQGSNSMTDKSTPGLNAPQKEDIRNYLIPESAETVEPFDISNEPSQTASQAPPDQVDLLNQPHDLLPQQDPAPDTASEDENDNKRLAANFKSESYQGNNVLDSPTPPVEDMLAVLQSLRSGAQATKSGQNTPRKPPEHPFSHKSDEEPSVQVWVPQDQQNKETGDQDGPAKYVPWWNEESSTSSEHFQDESQGTYSWEEEPGYDAKGWSHEAGELERFEQKQSSEPKPAVPCANPKETISKVRDRRAYFVENGRWPTETSAERHERKLRSKAKGEDSNKNYGNPPPRQALKTPSNPIRSRSVMQHRQIGSNTSFSSKPRGTPGTPGTPGLWGQGSTKTKRKKEQRQRAKERAAASEATSSRQSGNSGITGSTQISLIDL